MERIEIPKDCCLCDVCNIALTDENFVAIDEATWHEGWLYCKDCETKYNPSMPIIMKITKGDDLSKTDLAKPMIMEMY